MSNELEIEIEEIDRKIILRLDGRLDRSTAPRLETELNLHIDKGQTPILLDFTRVDYLSSAGLRVLLAATKKHRAKHPDQAGGHLIIFSLNDDIKKIVHDAGFDRAFRLCDGEKEALQVQ